MSGQSPPSEPLNESGSTDSTESRNSSLGLFEELIRTGQAHLAPETWRRVIEAVRLAMEEAERLDTDQDEELDQDCPICLNRVDKPAITNCGHTFCVKCLCKVHKAEGEPMSFTGKVLLSCPVCRKEAVHWKRMRVQLN